MIPYKSINQQFREQAVDIRNNIPHIVIGKDKPKNYNYPNPNLCPYCKRPFNLINQKPSIPINEADKQEKLFSNIRKWGLWIVISIVIGYAIYRLLFTFVFK